MNKKKHCPTCGSSDLETDFSNPVVWAYGTPPKYKCNNCGTTTVLVLESDKDLNLKGHAEIAKEESRQQPGYVLGMYEIGVMVLSLLVILALAGYWPLSVVLLLAAVLYYPRYRRSK